MVVKRNKRHSCVKCEPEQRKLTRWLSGRIRETAVLSVNLTAEGDRMVVRRNKRHSCVKCEPDSGRGQDGCQEE